MWAGPDSSFRYQFVCEKRNHRGSEHVAQLLEPSW